MRIKAHHNLTIFLFCMLVSYSVALIGSIFTTDAVNSAWYQDIKPSITPPNLVFPIVWTILFFLIGLSLYYAWTEMQASDKHAVEYMYAVNFLLNILWSVLYFGLRNPQAAFVEIIFLWLSILSIIIYTWKISRKASLLMLPYLLWVAFAAVLNLLTLT